VKIFFWLQFKICWTWVQGRLDVNPAQEEYQSHKPKFVGNECKSLELNPAQEEDQTYKLNSLSWSSAHWTLASCRIMLVVPCVYSENEKNYYRFSVVKVQSQLVYRLVFSIQKQTSKSTFCYEMGRRTGSKYEYYTFWFIYSVCVFNLVWESITCFGKKLFCCIKILHVELGNIFFFNNFLLQYFSSNSFIDIHIIILILDKFLS
jgi:hypothetical protein